jgi:hypothetical protein
MTEDFGDECGGKTIDNLLLFKRLNIMKSLTDGNAYAESDALGLKGGVGVPAKGLLRLGRRYAPAFVSAVLWPGASIKSA